jgi:hypothetical protein
MPSAGCSNATTKPFCVQNSRKVFHAASGVALTTTQRSDPARTSRASGLGGRSSLGFAAARAAAAPDAVCAT